MILLGLLLIVLGLIFFHPLFIVGIIVLCVGVGLALSGRRWY